MKKLLAGILSFAMLFGITANAYDQVYTKTYFADTNEKAFQEVCMLSLNSNAMIVNGAVRYIDDDDLTVTPKLYEARTYLPLKAVEMLYKVYTNEEKQGIDIDLRSYNFKNDVKLNITNSNTVVNGEEKDEQYIIYVEGEPYIALRSVGENIGKTVLYNNGYIIVGDESYANAVNANEENFNYGKNVLDSFKPEKVGNTIFVSATAQGGGDGSKENPYTLSEASNVAVSGDTVYLRGGTYRETLVPQNDGTSSKPIVYKAYNNEKVTLSALEEVDGLSVDSNDDSLLTSQINGLSDGRNQIFYNGEALVEARFPNVKNDYEATDVSPLFLTKGDLKVTTADDSRVESELLKGNTDDYWVGAKFVSLHGNAWSTATAVVNDSGDGWFTVDNKTQKWWYTPKENKVSYGYLTGHRNCIDQAGEWVVENNNLIIKAPENETADTLKLEYKARQLAIDLKNKKYIHIDGINTIGGGINMNDSEMCILKNCNFRYISHYTLSTDQREGYFDTVYKSQYNVTDENGAPRRGEMGIYVSGKNDVIRNCKIDTSAGAGIYMTGLYSYISNNEILNTGYMGSNVSGIYIGAEASLAWGVDGKMESDGTTNTGTTETISDDDSSIPRGGYVITNNRVRNAGRGTLVVQPPESGWTNNGKQAAYIPCEIAYNRFENGGITACDTGVVYLWGASMGNGVRNTRFHNNAVSLDCNIPQDNLLSMIYYDNYVNGVENYNNLVCIKSGTHSSRLGEKAPWKEVNLVSTVQNALYIQNQNPPAEVSSDVKHASCIFEIADNIDSVSKDKYPDGEYFYTGVKN